ncbi:MAG: methyltransferase domain-containing protein [Polyangiaceae bacterium]
MKRLQHEIGSLYQFIQKGMTNFDQTAALLPSSRFLVDAMLDPLPLASARCVVELGSGTGALTRKILERMGPNGHVHTVEIDEVLLNNMVESIRDDRLRPAFGSAADTRALMNHVGCTGQADAVVSSLGLSLIPSEVRDQIIESVGEVLSDDAWFVQYAYLHARWFAYSQTNRKWFRWYARPYLEQHFDHVTSRLISANIPPAVVYKCRGKRRPFH